MPVWCRVILAALLVVSGTAVEHGQKSEGNGTTAAPERRAAHLLRGVNLSDWLRQVPDGRGYAKADAERAVTVEDLALIRAMGFDHVRLCVNPAPLFRPHEADRIPPESLAEVDAALKMILDADLAVDLDIQPDDEFKGRLADDGFVEQYADFWRALARHYSSLDPDRVFFEIINEPEFRDPYRWYGVESRLAAAIREGAPLNTIIATGAHFSDEDDLLFLQPLRDDNVIYAFHFYQPFLFTHQGATWSEYFWHFLKGVPYPSRPDAARAAAALVPDPLHRLAVERYGESHWNEERVEFEIGQVSAWAARWHVVVMCNEFGVYKLNANPVDRARWMSDVRNALESRGIGWTVWEYSGGFGVVTKQNGQLVPDESTLRALGRTLPPFVNGAGLPGPHQGARDGSLASPR